MHRVGRTTVVLLLFGLALAPPARAVTRLAREYRYGPERVTLAAAGGFTRVRIEDAVPEHRAGRPDLPSLLERVVLPPGVRVERVEVTALETAPLASGVRVAPAIVPRHEAGAELPSDPDPAFYRRAGFQPEAPVALGVQGFERGENVAFLLVTPVRWDAAAGRLERVSRLAVSLVLAPTARRPLERQRVVAEWERDGTRAQGPSLAGGARVSGATSASGAALRVVPRAAEPFRPTQIPSLLGSPVAYVIVTDDALVPAFQVLADWKTASGVPAVVRSLSFVRAQYPAAADDAERVRSFLRDAYTRWGTRWALLGGDTEILPARYAHINLGEDVQLPSDLYYSCLDGNWNADGDSTYADGFFGSSDPGDDADLLPELWVGRAPVVTPVDAERFVQKTLTYERTPVADAMSQVLFFAEVLVPQNWNHVVVPSLDGAQIVEQDILPILDTTPGIHYGRLYENNTDSRWRPGARAETRAVVLDSLGRGYNLAVHVGHGYRTVMSCGDDNLTGDDAYGLANGDRLTNLYAIDCTSNAIDFASIGEAFVRAPAGGAVTNIGSTGLDFPTVGRNYQKEYFRLLFQDSVTAIGEAQGRQKLPFVGNAYYDGFDRWTQLTLLLLGDPELRIFTAAPRELEVVAPGSVPSSDSSLTVHVGIGGVPLYGARVTAWMPDHEYQSALTDGAGDLVLPFRPDSLGACSLTVTAFNARPWRGRFQVVAGGPAALGALAPIVFDDALDGRHGNGDGIADAGETFDLLVPVRNTGGTPASGVSGTLATADGMVAIPTAAAGYGAIAPGASAGPAAGFRVSLPFDVPDQREVPFTLDLVDAEGEHFRQSFRVVVHAPELAHVGHVEAEPSGNGDGLPQAGETVTYAFRVRNLGTGAAHALAGHVASDDGLSTVLDSLFSLPDLAPGAEALSTPVRFSPASAAARLTLRIDDADGTRLLQGLDLGFPAAVTALAASGGAGSVRLTWAHDTEADLAGYNLYRATAATGPFTKVNPLPTGRTSTAVDAGLAPLTRYYYQVTAVDSSGNESGPSATAAATTNPPLHPGFPAYTRESTPSPVCVERIVPGPQQALLVGGSVLHLFRADGSAPVDADGLPATPGDFTTLGRNYAGGGSISDLDGTGARSVIGGAWDTQELQVFDAAGVPRPGFPVHLEDQMWSSIAVGDLNGDGHKEMVFGSRSPVYNLGRELYVFRSDGTEWMDGDANPATVGVFKVMGSNFNDATPALADLMGTGEKDIVYGSFDGNLYAWRPDGSNVPGFPVFLGAMSGSAAVGRIDGPSNPPSIVVPVLDNSIRVLRADGTVHPGFPVYLPVTGTNRSPSPALADMNGDGLPDLVIAGTNGRLYVVDHNGAFLAPWGASRFSTLTSGATQASPVVADLDGDGLNDVVIGDENGSLAALSGATGAMLPGFPIQLEGEASGTAALCDCDADGKSEIAVMDFGGTLWVWDYDFPFSPGGPPPWPQFHHDGERTGNLDTPSLLAVDPAGPAPRVLELAAPRPNPARGPIALRYAVPPGSGGALELAVFDLAGRRVRTLEKEAAGAAGFATAIWDLRDDRGGVASSGVYLVRLRAGGRALTRKLVVVR